MAVTAAVIKVTPNETVYECTQDGAAGTTLNIDGAAAATPDLKTDTAAGTPLGDLMRSTFANQAEARKKLEGRLVGASGVPDKDYKHAELELIQPVGVANWGVIANVTTTNPRISITAPAGASVMQLRIKFQQSLIR